IGDDRVQPVAAAEDPGFGAAPGLRVHVPEVQPGDVIAVEVERSWPRADRFAWRPGARGALQIATLEVPEEIAAAVTVEIDGPAPPPASTGRGGRSWWWEEVPAGAPEPFTDGEAGAPAGRWSHGLALLLPQTRPLRGLGDADRSATLRAWRQVGGEPLRIAPPRTAAVRWCVHDDGRPCGDVGGVAWRVEPALGARWGWIEPGSWPGGEVVVPATVEVAQVSIQAPAGTVVVAGGDPVAAPVELLPEGGAAAGPRGSIEGFAPLRAEVRRRFRPGARAQWVVAELDGIPVLPDRSAAEQLVARLAVQASVPEPGVGAAFRGRKRDPAVVAEVLDVLRARMQPGRLPGQRDLAPRKLLAARRSGWGNPWELALVLTRYLRQLKLEATPLPARPARWGAPLPGAVEGWPAAVVAVDLPGGSTTWIDPACPTCAVGQLLPELDAAWVLSPGLDRLPPLPASGWTRSRVGDEVTVVIDGPLAVSLRRRVLGWPPEQRAERLAATFGGRGATLVEHQGITAAADAIRLRLQGGGLPPRPEILGGEEAAAGWAPVRGTWVERTPCAGVDAPPGDRVVLDAAGLRWTRTIGDGVRVERLVVERHDLGPDVAAQLAAALPVQWGRDLAGIECR
ncbi:MAG: hypothetical protein D6798_00260, partial [Deltaproteobacteria bacterium]